MESSTQQPVAFDHQGQIFACRFCGRHGMQWAQVTQGQWLPWDLLEHGFHRCLAQRTEPPRIRREEVIEALLGIGFEAHIPRCSSWQLVLTAANDTHSLFFMVGRRNLDFRVYDRKVPLLFDDRGRLYTVSGEIIRNRYRDNSIYVHQTALQVAARFVRNKPIDGLLDICREASAACYGWPVRQ